MVLTARKLNRLAKALLRAYHPFMCSLFFHRYDSEHRNLIERLRVERAQRCERLLAQLRGPLHLDWEGQMRVHRGHRSARVLQVRR